MRIRQKPVIQRREQQRHIARSVGHARGGEGHEEGFLPGSRGREGRQGGEDVGGRGGADCDFGARGGDADAGDDDVGGAAVAGQGFLAVFGAEDVAFGDGEVGVEGGLGDAFFEEEGAEFGWGADD